MPLRRVTWREMGRRPGRALLTVLSIAIGVAAVVAVALGTATTRNAYRQMYQALAGRAALQVTAAGGTTFDEELCDKIQQVPGVQLAVPSLQRMTILYVEHRRLTLPLMGIDPRKDGEVRNYTLSEGRTFQGPDDDGLLLERSFAEGLGVHVGDEVKLMTSRGLPLLKRVKVVGLLTPADATGLQLGGLVFLPLGLAEEYYTETSQINTVDLVLQPGANPDRVSQELRKILPLGLDVRPPATRTELAEETLLSIQQGMQFSSDFSIALAVILIVNAFLMNVSERRRSLAILRSVGATRGQVVGMLLREGLLLGVLGTVLGCLLGAGGGYLLMRGITGLYAAAPPPVTFSPWAFVLAAFLGPGVAVAAAALPAYMASRIAPLEAMHPIVATNGHRAPRWLLYSGIGLAVASGILLELGVRGAIPIYVTIPVAVASMVAIVLLMPWFVGPLGRLIVGILGPWVQLEGRLAQREIRRRPVRTALTLGVLFMAVSLGIGQGTTILNNINDVRSWFRQTILADFVLRATPPNSATGQTIELPTSLQDELAKIPGITHIGAVRFFNAEAAGHRVTVVARDFSGDELPVELYQADPQEVRQRLEAGEVVVGTVLAQNAHLKVGDLLPMETRQGTRSVRIAALAVDYLTGGHIVFMRRSLAEELFDIHGVDAFLLQADPHALTSVREALGRIAREQGLLLHSFAEMSHQLDTILSGLVGGLWGILVLGFVVAAFGVANTLSMSVLEQTRDLALLRVVAMTRGQVRKLVLYQAGLLGLIGLALGMLSGAITAYMMTRSMMPLLGYPVPFILHPLLFAVCFGGGMVLVLVASLLPAERAARLDLPTALQYE